MAWLGFSGLRQRLRTRFIQLQVPETDHEVRNDANWNCCKDQLHSGRESPGIGGAVMPG